MYVYRKNARRLPFWQVSGAREIFAIRNMARSKELRKPITIFYPNYFMPNLGGYTMFIALPEIYESYPCQAWTLDASPRSKYLFTLIYTMFTVFVAFVENFFRFCLSLCYSMLKFSES
jgi:hypothetical protein